MSAFVYTLLCADGSFYVGSARGDSLDRRIGEHQSGLLGGYTSTRRPVRLVFAEQFGLITDAIATERRIKGWSRAKKEALINRDWDRVRSLAKRLGARPQGASSASRPPPEVPLQPASRDAPELACVLRGPASPGASA